MLELCVVMPAYNEAACIAEVIDKWGSLAKQVSSFAMIVVNDGSKDNTGPILDSLAPSHPWLTVIHQQNGGHGRALRRAYDEAVLKSPQWVFQVDSDDQFIPEDFPKLWTVRNESLFLLGYRKERHDDPVRLVITRVLRVLLALAASRYVPDSNIPFRLIRGDYLKKLLPLIPNGVFAPNILLSLLAARDGQDLKSIPVHHKARQTGTNSLFRWGLFKACFRCAKELIKFRMALGDSLKSLKA